MEYKNIKEKIKNKHLNSDEIKYLKKMYQFENKKFIDFIRKITINIQKEKSLETFYYLYEFIGSEISDISPFISKPLNQIFLSLVRMFYIKKIIFFKDLMCECGNDRLLIELKQIIKKTEILRFSTPIEIYKIKKIIFILSQKLKQRDEIALKIETEIRDLDLDWIDTIE